MSNFVTWTAAMERDLRRLWSTHSASQIAKMIFTPAQRAQLTQGGRNAVIGKAHRMNLSAKGPRGYRRDEPKLGGMHPADRRALRAAGRR